MLAPRWHKVFADLLNNKSRTILVVLAISVGIFAFGGVFITQEVLLKNLDDQYKATNASNVSIFLSDFDSSLVNWVSTQPNVLAASGKAKRMVKLVSDSGDEVNISLTSVPDFEEQTMNLIDPKRGTWPPLKGELILERSAIASGKVHFGNTVSVNTQGERVFKLIVSGIVYDTSAFPYVFTNVMSGYVSWDTLGSLGFPKKYNQLDIKTSAQIKTLDQAEKFTFDLSEKLKQKGMVVGETLVFQPNQHWATDNSKAFTAILSMIGIFSLVMSGFLVVNTISALLSQQKKQIGVMKAIGANQKQIISLYLMMVCFYGLLALVIALPLGMLLGYVFLKMVSDFLNLDINTFYLPPSVFLMELAAALLIPIIAAIIPIFQGTKKSVREVISDYQPSAKISRSDKLLARITGFSRPVLISIRNTFRKKARLALTLGTLVTAGALFIGVINVRSAMFKELDRILQMFDFEVSFSLPTDYIAESMVNRIKEVPKVQVVEARTGVMAERIKPDGTKGKQFVITGLPPETVFSHPVLLSGRWLQSEDKEKIVLSSAYIRDNPDLKVGDNIIVEIENDKHVLEIVGVIAMTSGQGESAVTFSDFGTVSRLKDSPNMAASYLIKTDPKDAITQNEVAGEIENKLKRSGITISNKSTKDQIYSAAANQFNFLIYFLLAMAVMVAVVGGLGLAGTMSLNVLERTREIGIMRSIGASDRAIKKIVVIEGFLMGFISFVLAIPLSMLLTYMFCVSIGNAFFDRILVFVVVPTGMIIWLVIVAVIATIASIIPANRASSLSINETLSYE